MPKLPDPAKMSDAIASIWESAAEPERWTEAMRSVNALMPECDGFVTITPFAEGPGNIWRTIDAPEGFMEQYYANWMGRDTTLHAIARRMPVDRIIYDIVDIAPDLERCDVWQQLYVPHGINDMTCITVNGGHSGGADALSMAGFTGRRQRAEGLRRRRIMASLARHFGGAAALHWRLVRAQSDAAGTKSILDRLAIGIITLGAQGLALELNQAAKRILDSRDGLFLAHGKVATRELGAMQQLEKAIAGVLAGGAERPLAIPRENRPALTVIVAPVAVDRKQLAGNAAKAIMFISDPELVPDRAGARIAALYGLTRSEADIAEAIAAGKDIAEIAEARGTTLTTARTQLKTMMGKIGASRQSDIVRAVLAVPILDPR
jgi:DNA-binding CsgD family transcriptional regulator